jgi:hypothetical protein
MFRRFWGTAIWRHPLVQTVVVGDVTAAQSEAKCSELGEHVVGAAELVFGLGGGHELHFCNKAAWKKKLKKAVAVAAQEEYVRMLRRVGWGARRRLPRHQAQLWVGSVAGHSQMFGPVGQAPKHLPAHPAMRGRAPPPHSHLLLLVDQP